MCNPVAGVMAVTSVAGAATSAMAASDAASEQQQAARQARDAAARNAAITRAYRDQQYALAIGYQQELSEWQNSVYLQNAASVADSTRGQYNAIVKRIDQIRAKTLDDIGRASRAAQEGQSFVRTAASETGTTGNSVALAQQQYALAEARFTDNTMNNMIGVIEQEGQNMMAIEAQARSRILSLMPAPMAPIDPPQPVTTPYIDIPSDPSMLPYIIQGMSGVVNAYAYSENLAAMQGMGQTAVPVTPAVPASGFTGPQ